MPASIERLSANRDLNGMVRALRSRSDPQRREDAVHALGRWGDSDVYPWLLKAVLYDDDALVRQAARQVLREHLGAALDLALQVESSGQPEEQPWLVEEGEDGIPGDEDQYEIHGRTDLPLRQRHRRQECRRCREDRPECCLCRRWR